VSIKLYWQFIYPMNSLLYNKKYKYTHRRHYSYPWHTVVCKSVRLIQSLQSVSLIRRVWRYQRGNQNPYIEEELTTQRPKVKIQKDKQRSTKHTYKTKDRVCKFGPISPNCSWKQRSIENGYHMLGGKLILVSDLKGQWCQQYFFFQAKQINFLTCLE
jgi:hypothetical protein